MLFGRKPSKRYWDAAEYLCLNADELRDKIGASRWESMTQKLLAAKPGKSRWRESIAEVDDAAKTAGIEGGIGLGATMVGGFPPPPPTTTTGWACPTKRCRRLIVRNGEMATPYCALSDQPMRLIE